MQMSDDILTTNSSYDLVIGGMTLVETSVNDLLNVSLIGDTRARSMIIKHSSIRLKVNLLHGVGLISETMYYDLDTMAEIRNRWAHDNPTPRFRHDRIKAMAQRLSTFCDAGQDGTQAFRLAIRQSTAYLDQRRQQVEKVKNQGQIVRQNQANLI